jgi:hypothetical protein
MRAGYTLAGHNNCVQACYTNACLVYTRDCRGSLLALDVKVDAGFGCICLKRAVGCD